MKNVSKVFWLGFVFCVFQLHAEVAEIDELPFVDANGIRIFADVGKKHSIEIADTKQTRGSGEWWTVRAYVQNIGTKPVRVLLGRDSNAVVGFPDATAVNVAYKIVNESMIGNVAVKPPIADYRMVELESGEVAQLPVVNVQLKEKGKVSIIRITYDVDPAFGKWFEVWSGGAVLVLEKNSSLRR